LELDFGVGILIMGNTLEKMKVIIDKDLDAAYQMVDGGFEKVKVTIDKDFEKFIKSVGFFQR